MDTQGPRRYSPGDKVSIGFELSDESGIGDVVALFIPEEGAGEGLLLRGHGGSAERATVRLEGQVEDNHSPGKYLLRYLQATDVSRNTSMLYPEPMPHFYIEPHPGDSEGPRYEAWGFLD